MSNFLPSACAIASAQIVLPVPGGPAKLNTSPRPVACRSPRPQRPKIRLWLRTWPSAWSSVSRVAGGRMTSSNVRSGTIVSTARRPAKRPEKNESSGDGMLDYQAQLGPSRLREDLPGADERLLDRIDVRHARYFDDRDVV